MSDMNQLANIGRHGFWTCCGILLLILAALVAASVGITVGLALLGGGT